MLMSETKTYVQKQIYKYLKSQPSFSINKIHSIKDSIIRLEGYGSSCLLFFPCGRKIVLSKTMHVINEVLENESMIRIHRSHFVNFNCICKLLMGKRIMVELADGTTLPISRSGYVCYKNFLKSKTESLANSY